MSSDPSSFNPFLPDGPPYPKPSKMPFYLAIGSAAGGLILLILVLVVWLGSSAPSVEEDFAAPPATAMESAPSLGESTSAQESGAGTPEGRVEVASAALGDSGIGPASSTSAARDVAAARIRLAPRALGADEDPATRHHFTLKEPWVGLTFDDGPTPTYTRRLMDYLESRGVRATLFFIGKQAKANPELVREAARRGFEIGNHTWEHLNLRSVNHDKAVAEVQSAQDLFISLGLEAPTLIRFPYGNSTKALRRYCYMQGLTAIGWDVDTRDWERNTTPEQIVQRVEKGLAPGAIILLHEHPKATWEALPAVLDLIEARQYRAVPVGDLLVKMTASAQ